MSSISPKLIDVDGNRIGDDILKTFGIGNTGFVATLDYISPPERIGRFPTQLFTNIKNDKYKYVKYIT